jgi:fluoride ion exporter CrcB/FEX
MIDFAGIAVQILFGAFGATARFGVMKLVKPGQWSWGLFIVNMGGSLIVGVALPAVFFVADALSWSVAIAVFAFAAGFTTFSTLTLTAAEWAHRGEMVRGLALTAAHVVLGALVAGAGYISASAALGA